MASLEVAILAQKAKQGARDFVAAVRKIRAGGDNVAKGAQKTQTAMDSMAASLKKAATGMVTMAAAYKAIRFTGSSAKEMANFESSLAHISTMLDDQTMKYLPEYEAQIAKMAMTYGQSTKALGKGTFDIISGSFKAADAMAFLETATRSAMGGFTEVNISVKAMVAILNAYTMEAKEAGRVTDVMAAIVKTGVIEYEELASNIGIVVPIAAAAGLSLEELGAAIATITQKGVSARITMTALKAVVTTFLSPTSEAIELAAKYGLVLNAETLATEGLTGAMAKLEKASAEETSAIFSNVRALLGVEATRKTLDILVKNHTTNLNSLGMAEENYSKVANTTNVQLARNAELWKDIKRTLGEGIRPELNLWLEDVRMWAKAWGDGWRLMADDQEKAAERIVSAYEILRWYADPRTALKGQFHTAIKAQRDWNEELQISKENLLKQRTILGQYGKSQEKAAKAVKMHWSELEKKNQAFEDSLDITIEESDAVKKARLERQKAFKLIALEASLVGKTSDERERAILLLEFEANAKDLGAEKSKALTAAYKEQLEILQAKKDVQKEVDDLRDKRDAQSDAFTDAIEGDIKSIIRTPLRAAMESGDIEDVFKEELLGLATSLNKYMYESLVVDPMMEWLEESIAPAMEKIGKKLMDGLAKLAAPAADLLATFVTGMFGGGFNFGGGGGTAPAGSAGGGGTWGGYGSKVGANGLVFNNANVTPFAAGGVLDGPTIFPMANGGLALGGEAGHEALMPLSRGADGKLGVENKSGGSENEPSTIINVLDESMFDDYLSTGSGEKAIVNLMRRNWSELST